MTTYSRPMSLTALAEFFGSSESSQPFGFPVSTAQKRQARVHTEPRTMIVAVPAFQHSPIFGHIDSSHTVLKRCSWTIWRVPEYPLPEGICARNHFGLSPRTSGAASRPCFWPFLIAENPASVLYFLPRLIMQSMGAAIQKGQ